MKSEHLLVQLRSGSTKKKIDALNKLCTLKKLPRETVTEIQSCLDDADPEIRLAALHAVFRIEGRKVVPLAHKFLSDSHSPMKSFAAWLVSHYGEKHVGYPIIRSMLHSENDSERKAARLRVDFLGEDFDSEKPCAAELLPAHVARGGLQETGIQTVSCPLSRSLEVTIAKCDAATPLSPQQAKAIELIRQLPKSVKSLIRAEVTHRMEEAGELNDEDEPLSVEITAAAIPILSDEGPVYYFLSVESDYDIEHGIACLIRDGVEMCLCDQDDMRNLVEDGNPAALDALFASKTAVRMALPKKSMLDGDG